MSSATGQTVSPADLFDRAWDRVIAWGQPVRVALGSDRSRQRYARARVTALAEVGARGIGTGVALLTVPLTLSYLGTERYGMWMTISSLAALLAFSDLGLGSGLITAVARASGREDRPEIRRLSASAFWMLLGVAAVLLVAVSIASLRLDWGSVLNVSSDLARREATPSVLLFFAMFGGSLWLGSAAMVRRGLQEGYVNSAFAVAGSAATLGGLLAAIGLRLGLPYLVAAMMGGPLIAQLANAVHLYRSRPWLSPRLSAFHPGTARALLRSGVQFLVLQVAVSAAFSSDSFIAARVIGPDAVATYAVANKLFLLPTVLATAALVPFWPAYGEAAARGDVLWIRGALGRAVGTALVVTVPLTALLVAFSEPILRLWVGDIVRPPAALILGMGAWVILSSVGIAVGTLLNGLHLLRLQVVAHAIMAAANVAMSVYLAGQIGVAGVILGTVISYPVLALLPMLLYIPTALRSIAHTPSGIA